MSEKRTFIYRVEMGQHPEVKEIAFCYARNSSYAINEMQAIFKDRHYNMFKTYKLGETDYKKHPGSFEILPKDEEEYLRKIRSTVGEEYAERRRDVPGIYERVNLSGECGTSVQGEEQKSIQPEGERVSDSDK